MGVNEALTFDPLYVGDLSPDLDRGVVRTANPVTDVPSVADVPNLYVRTDLRTPGNGTYQLLTSCPLCDLLGSPLPPPVDDDLQPTYGGASDDFSHVLFEQRVNLTSDAAAQPPGCATSSVSCMPRAYEWSGGTASCRGARAVGVGHLVRRQWSGVCGRVGVDRGWRRRNGQSRIGR